MELVGIIGLTAAIVHKSTLYFSYKENTFRVARHTSFVEFGREPNIALSEPLSMTFSLPLLARRYVKVTDR